jgi:hemin uptake protein HemP
MSEFARLPTLTLRGSADGASRNRRMEKPHTTSTARPAQTDDAEGREQRVLRSETLLEGRSHIHITHNGETYQLRATRLGKLILTK